MMEVKVKKKLLSAFGDMELDVAFHLPLHSFTVLGGPSGSGKTTLLRILAGLERADEGMIRQKEALWLDTNSRRQLPPQKRRVGFVFQDYALFPNMTVGENLRFGLRKDQKGKIIPELIEIMELEALVDRYPAKLSGGQKQRVAVARALVPRPHLLLLDEPLSALDLSMRRRLQDYILEVHRRFRLTTLMVTHDIEEILKMADQVFLLENGRIQKAGSPREVFFPESNSADGSIKGRILEVCPEKDCFFVWFGDQVVRLPMEGKALKAGDEVRLNIKASKGI
jgi:molybdate transport system ATP-binding protein